MAEPALDLWDRLNDSSKLAFGLAAGVMSAEGIDVWKKTGIVSEAFLGGMLHAHPGASEPQQLLEHFGLSPSILGEAIEGTSGLDIRLHRPSEPVSLSELPPLSPNLQSILEKALRLSEELNPEEPKSVRLRDLFGGILSTPECVAFQALTRTLEGRVPIEEVQKTYPEFLTWPSSRPYSEFLSEQFPRPVLDIQARAVSDMPSEEDVLGFRPLVEGLDALLNDERTSLPLAIALTAPWGAGKSSVMLQVRKRLEQPPSGGRPRPRRWYTIRFDAWKYEKSERLWAALAKAVYDQPQKRMGFFERAWFRLRLEWRRRWKERPLASTAPALGSVGAIAALALLVFQPDWVVRLLPGVEDLTNWIGSLAIVERISSFTLVSAGPVALLLRLLGIAGHPFKGSLQAHVTRPLYQEQLGFTAEAERDISHLIETLTGSGDRALAIFVDDLDRCSSRHVVEVVEAINQIFNSVKDRPCVFILGMDREVVAASLEVAYKEMVDHLKERENPLAQDYGFRFLSKVVQMAVAVPAPDAPAMERLIARITSTDRPTDGRLAESARGRLTNAFADMVREKRPANPGDVRRIRQEIEASRPLQEEERRALAEAERQVRAEVFTADSEHVRQAEREVLHLLDRNPRQVKRFDNAFRLQLHVANGTPGHTLDFSPDQLVALGKWVALRLRWPRLAEELDREMDVGEVLRALEEEATAADPGSPDGQLARYRSFVSPQDQEALRELLREPSAQRRISSLPLESFLRVT